MLCAHKAWKQNATGCFIRVRPHQTYNSPSTFTLCRRRRGGHGTSYNSSWAQCDGTGSNEWGVHCWLRMRRFKGEGYELYCPQRFRMRIFNNSKTLSPSCIMTSHVIRSPILSQKKDSLTLTGQNKSCRLFTSLSEGDQPRYEEQSRSR